MEQAAGGRWDPCGISEHVDSVRNGMEYNTIPRLYGGSHRIAIIYRTIYYLIIDLKNRALSKLPLASQL